MSPATLLFGILLGMLIAAPFTYIWTSRKFAKEETDLAIQGAIANVEKQIFALEGYIKGQDATLAEFKLEQIPLQTNEGLLRKRFYVTLRERLVYKGIPLPWWITKIPVGEKARRSQCRCGRQSSEHNSQHASENGGRSPRNFFPRHPWNESHRVFSHPRVSRKFTAAHGAIRR
jgi:hypothetical protein